MNKFLLIASDIHSDDEAFEKLAKKASCEDCLGFLYAGDLDIENYFISNILRNRNFVFIPVCGNCDSPYSYQDASLPVPPTFRETTIGEKKFFITHGHLYSDPESAGLNDNFDIVINGHTHIYSLCKKENYVFLNPGSASRPRGYTERSYATVTFKEHAVLIEIKSFETDRVLNSMLV